MRSSWKQFRSNSGSELWSYEELPPDAGGDSKIRATNNIRERTGRMFWIFGWAHCVHQVYTDLHSTMAPLLTLTQLFRLSVPTVSTSILLKLTETESKGSPYVPATFIYILNSLHSGWKCATSNAKNINLCLHIDLIYPHGGFHDTDLAEQWTLTWQDIILLYNLPTVWLFLPSLPASASIMSCSTSHFSTRCPAGCSAMCSCNTETDKQHRLKPCK